GPPQLLRSRTSIGPPHREEFGSHADVVLNALSSVGCSRDWIRHVYSRRVAVGSGSRPGYPRACRAKERCHGDDLLPHPQWNVTPMSPAAVQVRTIDEVANADDRAEPVVRETLQMVDEVLARE